MERRIVTALAVMAALVVAEAGFAEGKKESGAKETDKKYSLTCGMVTPATHQTTLSMQKFASLVKERTNGKVDIAVRSDGQLGGERELLEGVQLGTIDLTSVTTTILANAVPEYLVFDLPFLFPNEKAVFAYFDSPEGRKLLGALEAKKMKGIGYLNNGFRVTTSNKPISSLADTKGLSIRTMENQIHLATWKNLGAQPTPMAFQDLFTALQQKVIDAQENPTSVIASAGFYQIQKYISLTNHINSMTVTAFNKAKWDSLPANYQQIIMTVQKEVEQADREAKTKANEADLAKMTAAGMKVVKSEDIDLAGFKKAVQPVYDTYADKVGRDLLNSILNK